ncbi:polysaccharide deacetylase [Micromonospora craterilacus]|uniref:Polysaccharide deacetylase n=1 Tax=Micromonospora craterilacus TaxID=1655439 RepID=A0A2W2EMQ0_9ACTN|nr:polysaccharide deacetylase [Micromonospora craterilacus]
MKVSPVPLVATLAAVLGAVVLLALAAPLRQPEGTGIVRPPTSDQAAEMAADEEPDRGPDPAPEPSPTGIRTPEADVLPGATRPGTRPPVLDHGPRSGNKVALTFDADMTDAMRYQLRSGSVRSYANLKIIDLLERDEVPATFFLTGKWVEQYPQVTRRLAANPRFELANHTYGHLAFTPDCYGLPRIARREMTADVARTFDVVGAYGGRQTRYFRFPGLCHDRTALTELAPLGLTVVDGDVVSGDPFATSWRPIVRAVLDNVRPGSVVVLHVTEANAPMTDEALPHILAGLADRGLEPALLSEVLGDGPTAP